MTRKTRYLIVILICFSANYFFSQTDPQTPFNASLWNGYADKIHLTPKEREEFISAHERFYLNSLAAPQATQQSQPAGGRDIDPNNLTFAGPCINADFELGNMTGWTRTCGYNPNFSVTPGCCPTPNGQQTITSGAANDPFGSFPVVCPGGNYSLRVGNSLTGGEADRIEQTFLVSASNANFSYKYAVVFQDPGHTPIQQPYFEIELVDTTGAQIPCTHYYVASGAGIPGFFNSSTAGVIYKPWSTVLVDLTPYIGQNITIRFSTFDCSLGGHFGYAYIDGVCQSFSSGGSATVCAGTPTTFCAPAGVDSYTWNGPGLTNFVGQCGTMSAPGIYTVTTTLFTGCPGPAFTYTLVNQAPPVASAGPPSTVCANNNTVGISGSITGFTATPVWSSGGSGVFTSTANINTTYTPSAADIAVGSVTITLTTAGNGVCPAATDKMVVSVTPSPVVNAGTGGSNCTSDPFALHGTVTAGATTGTWSTAGDGTFSPAANVLTASYTPGPADITAGLITLTLTSTNNGNCFSDSDTLNILIKQPATSNAGANQFLCSTTSTIAVSGTIGAGSSSGIWGSSGSGGFSSTTSLSTVYSITPADITAGGVTFTLTSTNNGPCPAAIDTVKMLIIKPAVVTAASNQFLCSTSGSVNLNGTVTGFSSTGNWTSSGAGAFNPGPAVLGTSYSLTPADVTAGTVIFTLTSTNNGACAAVRDSVMMRIRIPATAGAGANQMLCSNAVSVNLSGTIGGGSSTGTWSDSGAGALSSPAVSLSNAYAITAADIAAGSVIFTLTSTNNGPCPAVTDTVMMAITKIATVTAGPNLFVCSNAATLNLAGSVISPSNTVAWSSNGSGLFLPNTGAANNTYSFSSADVASGTVIFTLTSTNNGVCPAVSDTVQMKILKLASVNAGAGQVLCSNISSVALSGTVTAAGGTGAWSSGGAGSFVPGNLSLTTSYSITPADIGAGSVVFTLSSTNNGPCPVVSNTVNLAIVKIATVSAGVNQYVCSSQNTIALSGSVTGVTSSGQWNASGFGSFAPGNTALGGSYSLTATDVANGTVNFTLTSTNNSVCPAVSDTVQMKILKLPAVNAGTGQVLCSNISSVALSGTVTAGGGTGAWSSGGAGSFVPGNLSLTTSYSITPADIGAGSVVFTLSSTNNGPCPAVSNTVGLAISKIATVSAGANQYVCSSQNTIALSGSVTGVTSSGQWGASGFGSFAPGNAALGGSYSLTATDVTNGTVTFTLTSTNNSVCPAVSDTVQMKIMKLATVNPGTNQTLCSNISSVTLNGTVAGSSGTGIWSSSGAGTFVPGNALLATAYSITPADIGTGLVVFTLSSTNNGPCPIVSNTVGLAISHIATVSAGPNQYLCSSQNSIALSGSVTGVTSSGHWASSGAGNFLPGNTTLNGSYSLTAADISNGTVTFTLASTNNSVCPAVSDTVKMRILKLALVNAGTNQAHCSNITTITLNGTVAGASGTGTWSSGGAGIFVPGTASLITAYSVTPADISNGQVIFTLSSTGNGPCPSVSDTVKMTIRTIATVSAGVNQFICSTQNSIALNGMVTGGTSTGQWSSSGAGGFSPGNTVLANSYSLTPSDIVNGAVTFTLTSTNNGVCPAIKDTVKMKVMRQATVNAGTNRLVCSTQGTIALNGSINGGSGASLWTSSGNGGYNPQATSLNPSYVITSQDINAGVVIFTLSSQNDGPCLHVTDTVGISIRTPAQVIAGPSQTICSGSGSINLSGSVSGGMGTVQWTSDGAGNFNPDNTSTVTAYAIAPPDVTAGTVHFTLVSTNNGTCPQSISDVIMFIKEKANVNAGADKAICSNQLLVPLQGTISGVTNAGTWTGSGTGAFTPNAPAGNYSVSAADISQGSVMMVLASVNNDVCPVVTDTLKLTIETKPLITVGADTTLCDRYTLIPLTSTASVASGLQWTTSGSGLFIPSNAMAAAEYSLSLSDKAAGTVSLMLGTSSNGACGYTGATMKVHVLAGPHAAFSASAYTIQLPGSPVQFNNSTTSANTYTWSFGDGTSSTVSDPAHGYANVGFYKAILIARNDNGCMDTTDRFITVISDVQVPNAFTPNTSGGNGGSYSSNDYSNDVFFMYAEGVVNYDMMIFNRWGELIFRSNDVKIGWDGYFNGKLCQQDAYVWKVNMEFFDGRKYNKTGSVTLLR